MAFLDNFNGEATTVDLASHVPSGGTAWTRVDGSANMAQVSSSSSTLIKNTTDNSGALYLCDDQGSADQYVQYVCKNADVFQPAVNRAVSRFSWVGVRVNAGNVSILKCVPGPTYTALATGTTTVVVGDTIRLESQGSTHRGYINGALELTVTDSHNSTVTRQGVVPRATSGASWLDDFEAGALAGGATGSLAATESGSDAASLAGDVLVSGALAAAESGGDSAAIAGAVAIAGSLAATESGADSAAISGPTVVEQPAIGNGGGGVWWPSGRRRTRDEIDDERRRLGILPPKVAEVVKAVAQQEAAKPVVQKAEIRRDFKRELAQQKALYRVEYLKALYADIEHQRLQMQAQEEEEEAVAVLLMALAA